MRHLKFTVLLALCTRLRTLGIDIYPPSFHVTAHEFAIAATATLRVYVRRPASALQGFVQMRLFAATSAVLVMGGAWPRETAPQRRQRTDSASRPG